MNHLTVKNDRCFSQRVLRGGRTFEARPGRAGDLAVVFIPCLFTLVDSLFSKQAAHKNISFAISHLLTPAAYVGGKRAEVGGDV